MTAGKGPFGAERRLRSKTDFDHVFERPVRSTDGLFTVLARPRKGSKARLGLAISRKSSGNAVSRNRIKRLVRESFRLNQKSMVAADIVVMAKAGIAARSNEDIRSSLAGHWKRIRERCATSS